MKLLFDQNISFRLIERISNLYPDAKQVRELGLENVTDNEIFVYCRKISFVKFALRFPTDIPLLQSTRVPCFYL